MNKDANTLTGLEVAVIGMAGRFPGAKNCTEFWENLKNGVESIAYFSDQELAESGKTSDIINQLNFVRAKGVLEEIEYFDAAFFEYTPKQAEILNPQTRIFIECTWQALEDAGYDPGTYEGLIGLYAGASSSFYWEGLSIISGKTAEIGAFALENLTNKDHLCTTISYKLNLKGPSCIVQTTCSTALVAIHWASRAVLSGECHLALAGGITIEELQKQGYSYTEGMISSKDGHCRAFDAKASGTIGGNGAAAVVLKRLKKALKDGDHIYAIVKGSAINNDGKRKVGFTAPSVEGQATVIRTALTMARVEPDTIGYIETHGTGTTLGDPIEIEALNMAFKPEEGTPPLKKSSIPIGSVKTNVGHLNCAAGAAGFIKTVLALKNRQIPPNLHFETPNPKINFENSPFFVNQNLKKWENKKYPLRAGVSSFGIGGTNAHVILEEPPKIENKSLDFSGDKPANQDQLILLSAKTQTALDQMTQNLGTFLNDNPWININDLAYTLQIGRAAFKARRMLVGSNLNEITKALSTPDSTRLKTYLCNSEKTQVVFMFPGQGAQYVNMGRDLYENEPQFREEIDRCVQIVKNITDFKIEEILYPNNAPDTFDKTEITLQQKMNQTEIAQPMLFIIEYAFARLLIKWGVKPYAMIGHSIGEYTAACLAEVFSLEDALKIVVARGQLMQSQPHGSMLGVHVPEKQLEPLLIQYPDIQLAAVNSDTHSVVSGTDEDIRDFEKKLEEKEFKFRKLQTSHAFHSKMMEPILDKFTKKFADISLNKPKIPYISNLTGNWITVEEAVNPGYWAAHLRNTVRFAKGLEKLINNENTLFIEVGPGTTLSTFIKQLKNTDTQSRAENLHPAVNLLRHPQENVPDHRFFWEKMGQLWLYGVNIDWKRCYSEEKRHRISLPTYPFEKEYYWIKGNLFNLNATSSTQPTPPRKKTNISDWFYIPSWKKTISPLHLIEENQFKNKKKWLIFLDSLELGKEIINKLSKKEHKIITVDRGEKFLKLRQNQYQINPCQPNDYDKLVQDLIDSEQTPDTLLHMWSITSTKDKKTGLELFEQYQERGYYSLIYLAQALEKHHLIQAGFGNQKKNHSIQLSVITNQTQTVNNEEKICPEKTTILGPCKTLPLEYGNITTRIIDITLSKSENPKNSELADRLIAEALLKNTDSVIAYRNNTRWLQTLESIPLERQDGKPLKLRDKGVYLITGGLGKDSLIRAKYMANTVKARLILLGRTQFPDKSQWNQWMANHDDKNPTSEKIKKIKEIEEMGGEVSIVNADVANYEQMKSAFNQIHKKYPLINGVIHAAGNTSIDSSVLINKLDRNKTRLHFDSKIYGLYTLERLLQDESLDFILLTSSMASYLAGVGLTAYTAANIFMDAFALKSSHEKQTDWMSLNWIKANPEETNETFHRILNLKSIPQLAVFEYDYEKVRYQRNQQTTQPQRLNKETTQTRATTPTHHKRPTVIGPYIKPDNETEKKLAIIWESFFGISPLGKNDNFFELSGDSLSALTIIAKIHKEMDVELSLAQFFQNPTIKELAQFIQTQRPTHTFISIRPSEEKEFYALSSPQQRLYFIQQMYLDSTVYNLIAVIDLFEYFNKNKIEETINKLIQRHETLRTSFQIIDGKPVQIVHRNIPFKIQYEVKTIEEFVRPFDLTQAPLFRVGILHTEDNRNILVLDMHHIISDRHSHQNLQRDFITLYSGNDIPPLKIQYKDFTEWQNLETQKKSLKKQEFYWLNEFSDEIPVLQLPTDFNRPAVQDFAGETCLFSLSRENSATLKSIGLETGSTPYMTSLALLNVLLCKLSGQEDIVIGTPVAGRNHADLERIIGMFVNTLALRNFPNQDKNFHQFLIEVKNRTLKAFENQEYHFEDIVEKTVVNRDTSRNPLFDVMFDVHSGTEKTKSMEDAFETSGEENLNEKGYSRGISIFDMLWIAREKEDQLFWQINYSTKLFKKKTILKFIDYFKIIIAAIVQDPHQNISQLDILTEEERDKLIFEFNDTAADYPSDKTIIDLFHQQSKLTPDAIALNGHHHKTLEKYERNHTISYLNKFSHITYEELNRLSQNLSDQLKERGIESENIIAIMMERSLEMMIAIFAAVKSGGVYLPIDPHYPEERIDYILTDSKASIIITTDNVIEKKQKINAKVTKGELLLITCQDERTIETGAAGIRKADYIQESMSDPDDLIYIIYTSGSTGKPKGTMLQHGSLVNRLNWMQRYYPLETNDVILQKTTIAFDVSVWELFWWSITGSSLSLLAPGQEKDPEAIEETIIRNKITTLHFVPSMLHAFLEYLENSSKLSKLASLKQVFSSGEALAVHQLTKFNQFLNHKNHTKLINLYGPTEASIDVTFFNCPDNQQVLENIPIGKPIDNIQLFILNRYFRLQPIGVPGELCIAGIGLARGYLNRPELTSEKFYLRQSGDSFYKNRPLHPHKNFLLTHSPIYRTGDLAKWQADGNIQFMGRLDHQIKIRGIRVELEEIENQLIENTDIKEVVIFFSKNKKDDGILCAYIVPDIEKPDIPALKKSLAATLPDYMIPQYFIVIDTLPFTASGKIDKKSLPDPDPTIGNEQEYIPPQDEVEYKLTEIWSDILAIEKEKIGTMHNFFTLGGNSLNLITMVSKIFKEFAVQISITKLYNLPIIKEIANDIKSSNYTEGIVVTFNPSSKPSANKNIFCLPPLFGYGYVYMNIANFIQDYTWHAFNFLEEEEPQKRIQIYLEYVLKHQKTSPYILFGYSAAGKLTFQLANAIENHGHTVSDIIFWESIFRTEKISDEYRAMTFRETEKDLEQMGLSFMKEKVLHKSNKFLDYNESITNLQTINAKVHLLIAEGTQKMENPPIRSWDKFTTRSTLIYNGAGEHREMVSPGPLEINVEITKKILARIEKENRVKYSGKKSN